MEEKRDFNERIRRFASLPSTNEFCKGEDVRGGDIILAESQSSGRGRMGRSFISDAGGIYISFCYEPHNISISNIMPLTGMCAVAVIRSIKKTWGIAGEIKWLNDILLYGKKICGILAEAVLGEGGRAEKLIIGIGINANQSENAFEGELAGIASSVFALTGKRVDENALVLCLAEEIDASIEVLINKGREGISDYLWEYKAACSTLGSRVSILRPALADEGKDVRETYKRDPERFPTAIAYDIDGDFCLKVRYIDGKEESLFSGEISIKQE